MEETLKTSGAADNGIISKDDKGMYSVRYNDLMAPMVKAIKEQQSIISELVKKNDTYESQILKLSSKLEEIEKRYPIGH